MAKMHLEIVTPEKPIVTAEIDELVAPGALGEFGVLPGHTTLFTALGSGRLVYTQGNQSKSLEVSGGFAEVCDNRITVMADTVKE
ncbi:MAG: ATP synthase F1 subunit epsilon [Deltaproteobacteria bacterium]|nr:MAG: ATP synthase F1 subunit epsilon [Deltaproteobacteria bacterium]